MNDIPIIIKTYNDNYFFNKGFYLFDENGNRLNPNFIHIEKQEEKKDEKK